MVVWLARTLCALAVACVAFGVREVRLAAFAQHRSGQRYEDRYYLPAARWLPLLSLGYHQALADLIWTRSLVYFGEELAQRGAVKHVFAYTDAVLALDPSLRPAYRWVATAAIYRPRDVDIDVGLRAAEYLKRAVERWPRDGELHWDYASLLRFELAPLAKDKALKQRLLEQAAPHLEVAARLGAGPAWLGLNSVDLLNKLGRTEQAIRHLEELYGTVQDESVKTEIAGRLAQLRSRAYVEGMREAFKQFEYKHEKHLPYASADLFLLVGSPPSPDAYESFLKEWFISDSYPHATQDARGTGLAFEPGDAAPVASEVEQTAGPN